MGQETGDIHDDKKLVFSLEPRQIEELKDRMKEKICFDISPAVGSGWKLR
jgi:hypothetical protein